MRVSRDVLVLVLVALLLVAYVAPLYAHAEQPQPSYALGLVPSTGDFPKLDTSRYARSPQALASTIDLSGNLPPVGDQGGQNSCVGWTLAYYYKTLLERQERGWDVNFSQHQFSPTWVYNQRTTSECSLDRGMSFYDGLTILSQGAAPLTDLPNTQGDACTRPLQAVKDSAYQYRVLSFANVFSGRGTANLQTLKNLLADGNPVAIAVPVYGSFYGVTANNPVVRQHTTGETYYGGHALLVVGYDDAAGGFKVVNSWGTGWGMGGFAYLAYDFVQYDAWEAWVVTDYVEPVQKRASAFGGTVSGSSAAQGVVVTA